MTDAGYVLDVLPADRAPVQGLHALQAGGVVHAPPNHTLATPVAADRALALVLLFVLGERASEHLFALAHFHVIRAFYLELDSVL